MNYTILPADKLLGQVLLPPDKSIAHRTAIFAALGDGISRIVGYSDAADPQSTLSCLRQLGVIISDDDGVWVVEGVGINGLTAPSEPLDCGNSGTTMRLMSGVLAGQSFDSILIGDASLSRRTMSRIADPLNEMGANIELTDGHAPIKIGGQPDKLNAIDYILPIASAQVKSCVLLAGMYAGGTTTVIESKLSRDHTERMLGLTRISQAGGRQHIIMPPNFSISAQTWVIPKDFSAAAFFMVAGSIVPESEIHLMSVGLNPSRRALLDILRAMGADITLSNERTQGQEPLADMIIKSANLTGLTIRGALIPNLIDEIPILAVAGALAGGITEIRDATELRHKECDRISAMVTNLKALGVSVTEVEDGLIVTGDASLAGEVTVSSFDDHRIAMSMAIAALVADKPITISEADCVKISFPAFWEQLDTVALR